MDTHHWWGFAGVQDAWGPMAFARQSEVDAPREGVSRHVDPAVSWEKGFPWDDLGLPRWHGNPSYPTHFEMPLPSRPAPQAVWTLRELGHDLVQSPPRGPDDPRVAELEGVARRLLEIAAKLHVSGFRLGLVHPRNVLFVRGTGGREVILPDLGFTVASTTYDADWLKLPELAALCAPLTPAQQHVVKGFERAGPGPDVRLLARLFASVLLGGQSPESYARNAPLPDGKAWGVPAAIPPMTRAPQLYADVWGVLAQASDPRDQQVRTMSELADALKNSPLGGHFAPPRSRGGKPFFWAGAAAVLITAGGLAAWGAWPSKPEPDMPVGKSDTPAKPDEPLPNDSVLGPLVPEDFASLPTGELHKRVVELIAAESSEREPTRGLENRYRGYARSELCKRITKEMRELLDKFQQDPRPPLRGPLVRALAGLKQTLLDTRALAEQRKQAVSDGLAKEEKECLGQLERRLRQLDY